MQDKQAMRLLKILQSDSCKIWCLNIGETCLQTKTWHALVEGLKGTKVTNFYASLDHPQFKILKAQFKEVIAMNRGKHNMNTDSNNNDVIKQCTHCWT